MKGLQSAGKWCTLEVAVGALGIGRGTVSWQERVSNRATPGEPRGPLFLRTAELARRFASMFLSLEICEIENSKERANPGMSSAGGGVAGCDKRIRQSSV